MAPPKRTTLKKPSKTSVKPKKKARLASPRSTKPKEGEPNIEIAEQDVVLLQTTNAIGASGLQDIVFQVFDAERHGWRSSTAWLAFYTTGAPHHIGKTEWIGLSKSVPLAAVDLIQAAMQAVGLSVERAMGRVLHLNLMPFARLSGDGLEILVPAALVGTPGRIIERADTSPAVRGYMLVPDKAEALRKFFLGQLDDA